MILIRKHLNVLKNIGPIEQGWVGGKPYSYARDLASQNFPQIDQLPNKNVTRDDLFKMVSSNSSNTLTCCVAIFAWGGMRRDHARSVLKTADYWIPIADTIRTQGIGRVEAYSQFMLAREKGKMKGMGPAFFTKLIYFLGINTLSPGYIMDQWTALSANLLLGYELVDLQKLKKGMRVSDKNTSDVYEKFCIFIEELAKELNETAGGAEMRIFSVGGRSKHQGEWRSYVKENSDY